MPEFRVRMFAHHKDRHGDSVTVNAEPNAGSILSALQRAGVETRSSRLSVNLGFVESAAHVNEGDELALIPPVSGG